MESYAHSQVYIFFATVYGGIIIGFIYDIYRIFRYFFKPKRVATFFEDLMFWISVSLVALYVLIFSNWGELRGYIFIGFLLGAFLYNKLLSKIVITILVHIVKAIANAIKYMFSIVIYPFKALMRLLYSPYQKGCKKVKKEYTNLKRKAKLPFRVVSDNIKNTKKIIFKK